MQWYTFVHYQISICILSNYVHLYKTVLIKWLNDVCASWLTSQLHGTQAFKCNYTKSNMYYFHLISRCGIFVFERILFRKYHKSIRCYIYNMWSRMRCIHRVCGICLHRLYNQPRYDKVMHAEEQDVWKACAHKGVQEYFIFPDWVRRQVVIPFFMNFTD